MRHIFQVWAKLDLYWANGRGGFGAQTARDPPGNRRKTPDKQTACTVTTSHMPALEREAAEAEERLPGDLRQSVPQKGRVHSHIMEFMMPFLNWRCLLLRGWMKQIVSTVATQIKVKLIPPKYYFAFAVALIFNWDRRSFALMLT